MNTSKLLPRKDEKLTGPSTGFLPWLADEAAGLHRLSLKGRSESQGITMKTTHQIYFRNANNMEAVHSNSVDLIVTSPPYPMIEMWDEMFVRQDSTISEALESAKGYLAFEQMHRVLDRVWDEVYRILKNGGIACINIGDATRTLDGNFMLYPNAARITSYLLGIGFMALPKILWRKQTNAPNKFMGSGMLPPGAYVTLEHEYNLIFRKGPRRKFSKVEEKQKRKESAFFWEERNVWFSDVWMDLKGTAQNLTGAESRLRSAAYPFAVPYRLVNMFSIKGDTVVDPFLGTGTTLYAAMTAGRTSIGFEIEKDFQDIIRSKMNSVAEFSNAMIQKRIENHLAFVNDRFKNKADIKHINRHYGFPVMTRQETELIIDQLASVATVGNDRFETSYLR